MKELYKQQATSITHDTRGVSTSFSYLEIELAIVNYYGIRQHIIVPNCYINQEVNLQNYIRNL